MAKKTTRKKSTAKRASKKVGAKKAAKKTTRKAAKKTTKRAGAKKVAKKAGAKKAAKKATRKAAKKTAKKAGAKKAGKKKASRRKASRKAAAPAEAAEAGPASGRQARKPRTRPAARTARKGPSTGGPKTISTGKGPGPAELGARLVSMFNAHTPDEQIWSALSSPRLVSIEGMGQAFEGLKAVRAKAKDFYDNFTVHGGTAEGPFVGATGFAVKFRIDVETKATGERRTMEEVGVYSVKNGKIVQEEFMYAR